MEHISKQDIAQLVKEARLKKGYSQQELADLVRLSLLSVQRIESAEVLPRQYTFKLLAQQLDESPVEGPHLSVKTTRFNTARKIIITICLAILSILLTGAYIAQSVNFPKTTFEYFLVWTAVTGIYTFILLKIWR